MLRFRTRDSGPRIRYAPFTPGAAVRNSPFHLLCLTVCLIALPARAQEGHPLTGTWSGDWGPNANDRTHLTLVMEWDGNSVTGTLNPGPDAVLLERIALDVTSWAVHLEADAKDASGKPARITADGRLD